MLFSVRDFDLLRLLRWCRYILLSDLQTLFAEAEIENLALMKYIKLHEPSGSVVLTARGNELLDSVFQSLPASTPPSYRPADIGRRLRLSSIALTAYRGGIDLFQTGIDGLSSGPSLFLPAVTRGRGSNPWGNTRIAAIAHLGNLACAFHYVCPDIGKVLLTDELTVFSNSVAALKGKRQALIFAGKSYGDVLAELERNEKSEAGRMVSYGETYRQLRVPVHLLSCDDTGAMQLRIMSTPGYRARLTKAALKTQYQPPPEDFPACDAIFDGLPFLVAADMDLRRIDAAYTAARDRGCPQIVLAALEDQAENFLYARYRDTDKARVFTLTGAALTEVLGAPPALHSPSRSQFLTEKGDVINAPLIQAHRKAVPRHRKK